MNLFFKKGVSLISLLGMSITINSSYGYAKLGRKFKSTVVDMSEARRQGASYKKVGNYWIFNRMLYNNSIFYLSSIKSKSVENHYVTVVTYADPDTELVSRSRKNIAYTVGTSSIGIEYSQEECLGVAESVTDSLTLTLGTEIDALAYDIGVSVTGGAGSYINSSYGSGTEISYEVSYSFDTITSLDKANNLTYSLFEEVKNYHFFEVIIVDSYVIYMYTEYSGVVSYTCEKIGG